MEIGTTVAGTAEQQAAWTPARVVVLVDASPDAIGALEAAAELSARLSVPLLVVSVEEPDRIRSAGYAFAREVGALSGTIRQATRGRIAVRAAVGRVARAAGVAWELLERKGRLTEQVLALSRPGDLLMLGRVGWSARLGRRLGAAPLVLAREAVSVVRICAPHPTRRARGRIAVLLERTDDARVMLELAAASARGADLEIVVLLSPDIEGDPATLSPALQASARRSRLRRLSTLTNGELLRALAEEGAVELVVHRTGAWLASPAAERLLVHWRMPVLVVGAPDA